MKFRHVILIMLITIMSLVSVAVAFAQDDTGDETTSDEPTSTVFYFWGACENQAVIDLNGTMDAGFDVYVQVFRELGATGEALSDLLRVPVDGDYEVSQTIAYTNGTLNLGQFASVEVSIAAENNPNNVIYSETLDDVQDGCIEPAYSSVDSIVSDGTNSAGGTPLIDPVTGNVITQDEASTEVSVSTGGTAIYSPFGGILNGTVRNTTEAVVQIGARPSENPEQGRSSNPGLIFAECNDFPNAADPGIIYDTDQITIFWSWFAETPELVREHIANAQYEVYFSSPYVWRQQFSFVNVSEVVQREDGNYWVFYTAPLGDGFRPGQYIVDYYVTWPNAISDGYEEFGPGTETPFIISRCVFNVEINPFGVVTDLDNPTVPLQR